MRNKNCSIFNVVQLFGWKFQFRINIYSHIVGIFWKCCDCICFFAKYLYFLRNLSCSDKMALIFYILLVCQRDLKCIVKLIFKTINYLCINIFSVGENHQKNSLTNFQQMLIFFSIFGEFLKVLLSRKMLQKLSKFKIWSKFFDVIFIIFSINYVRFISIFIIMFLFSVYNVLKIRQRVEFAIDDLSFFFFYQFIMHFTFIFSFFSS